METSLLDANKSFFIVKECLTPVLLQPFYKSAQNSLALI